jgi:hypothetical protein
MAKRAIMSRNLFDKNNATIYQAMLDTNNGEWVTSDTSLSVVIPAQPNTQCTLSIANAASVMFRIGETSNDNPQPDATQYSLVVRGNRIYEYTFTTLDTTKYLIFQGSKSVVNSWLNSLMFNEGSVLPYEPFGVVGFYEDCAVKIRQNGAWTDDPESIRINGACVEQTVSQSVHSNSLSAPQSIEPLNLASFDEGSDEM